MNIFALISLIAAFICFFLGNFIYYKNPENNLNRLVAVLSILIGFLAFIEFGYRQAEFIETAILWIKVSSLWTLVPALLLNIFLVFTGKSELLKHRYTYILIYAPALVLAIIGIIIFPENTIYAYWGWTYNFNPFLLFFILMSVWSFIGGFVTSFFILKHYYNTSDELKKKQTKYIFLGLFAPFVFSLTFDYLIPLFGLRLPEITMISITIGLLFISYGIWKYRFPVLTPAMAADKILSTMSNFLIIMNTQKKIVLINQSLMNLLKYKKDDLIGESCELIFPPEHMDEILEFLNSHEIGQVKTFETEIRSSEEQLISVILSVSLIKISEKEPLGLVCIGSDLTTEKEMKKALAESEILYSTLVNTDPDSIVTTDLQGKIRYTSKQALHMYGYEDDELIDKSIFELINSECREKAQNDLKTTVKEDVLRNLEYRLIRKNGDQFIGEWNIAVIKDSEENPNAFMITSRDITHHKNIEAQMQDSLQEKNVLLKEIHHRVKNNLQIISSLLNLQSMYIEDEKSFEVFKESQNRVKSMAIIHEKLYQSGNFAEINITEYLTKLTENIYSSYGVNIDLVKLEINAQNIYLDINKAIPCFLVINEMITNSIKHAFPDSRAGKIMIDFKKEGDEYVVSIRDNGVGLTSDLDINQTNTLGMQLINGLISQIDGELMVKSDDGAEFRFIFK
jgi:PAS domain S-box-containing protein